MQEKYQTDDNMTKWLQTEQWFLRILGAALVVETVLGLISGILYNPNNEIAVTIVNVIIAIALGAGGIWTLYISTKLEYIQKALDGYIEQGSTNSYVYAGIQVVFGLLFLLEGTSRSLIVMTLLALTLLASAGFFVWRGRQISQYQD